MNFQMTLRECQAEASKMGAMRSMEFQAWFPSGWKRCVWIDAVEGWFSVDGVTQGENFLRVDDVLKLGEPVCCFLRRINDNEKRNSWLV